MKENLVNKTTNLYNENRELVKKIYEVNHNLKKEIYPLMYEITEDDKITFSRNFTLKEEGLYKYKTTQRISKDYFFRYSGKGRKLRNKPNPFYYVKKQLPNHAINDRAEEKIKQLFEIIEKHNNEISKHVYDFRKRGGYQINTNGFSIINLYRAGAFTREMQDRYIVHIPKILKKDNPSVLIFDDLSIGEDDTLYLRDSNLEYFLEPDTFEGKEEINEYSNILKDILEIFKTTNLELESILKGNRKILSFINEEFARIRVANEI